LLNDADDLRLGGASATAAYLGGTRVWPKTYRQVVMEDGPTAYWRLDETTGTTLVDERGAHHGTLATGATISEPPLINVGHSVTSGATADGIGTIPHHADLNGSATGMTFECWIRIPGSMDDRLWPIMDKSDGKEANGQWSIWYDNRVLSQSPQRIRIAAGIGGARDLDVNQSGHLVSAGGHLAITMGVNTSQWRIYWNAVELIHAGCTATWDATNTLPVSLGRLPDGTVATEMTMDEVAIYHRELSPERIRVHYRAGTR
jgi:hypothetical protein